MAATKTSKTTPKTATHKAPAKASPKATPVADKRDDTIDKPVAELIDPAKVPNMSNADINDATADGLKEDTGPKADAAEGLQEARDDAKHPDRADAPANPHSTGPGSDIA